MLKLIHEMFELELESPRCSILSCAVGIPFLLDSWLAREVINYLNVKEFSRQKLKF